MGDKASCTKMTRICSTQREQLMPRRTTVDSPAGVSLHMRDVACMLELSSKGLLRLLNDEDHSTSTIADVPTI